MRLSDTLETPIYRYREGFLRVDRHCSSPGYGRADAYMHRDLHGTMVVHEIVVVAPHIEDEYSDKAADVRVRTARNACCSIIVAISAIYDRCSVSNPVSTMCRSYI